MEKPRAYFLDGGNGRAYWGRIDNHISGTFHLHVELKQPNQLPLSTFIDVTGFNKDQTDGAFKAVCQMLFSK